MTEVAASCPCAMVAVTGVTADLAERRPLRAGVDQFGRFSGHERR